MHVPVVALGIGIPSRRHIGEMTAAATVHIAVVGEVQFQIRQGRLGQSAFELLRHRPASGG